MLATKFDNENNRDAAGMNFSERWLADGHGTWCYGSISRVYVKKGRHQQKYSIKYDVGGTMACGEEHIEVADVESSESDDSETGQRETMERDSDNEEGDEDSVDADEGGRVVEQDQDQELTDESEGERDETTERSWLDAEITEIGETVWCGKEDETMLETRRIVDGGYKKRGDT